jgi:uridine kinase
VNPFEKHPNVLEIIKNIIYLKNSFLIISICGGSCAGKTTLANYLASLNVGKVLSMDSYYRRIPEIPEYLPGIPAFDSPEAFELDRLSDALLQVKKGKSIDVPVFNYNKTLEGRGHSSYYNFLPTRVTFLLIREYIDYVIFIDRDEDKRRESRIIRDTAERGVSPERAAEIYDKMAAKLFDIYVLPQRKYAHFLLINN